ncbi:GDSL-like Lipase/Acylhydrolase superfamily protein [Euphorbia peplus]|nr:GDSL-like Lipase/Acylhydrolase superfamily protein [Euphorbia peplus]
MILLLLYLLPLLNFVANAQFTPQIFSQIQNRPQVSAMYVMGDSSVDCGENTPLYPYLHRIFSLVPCNGSDETLLPYLLAKNMGLPKILPFYGQNGSLEGLQTGLNFGSAHATIMKPGSESHQSLNQQLRQVLETFQLLELQLGEETAQQFIKSSVLYLSFGRDDYVDLYLRNSSGLMLKHTGQEFAEVLVDQIVHAMRRLYDANVRKIICMSILPLGCTPRTVWEWRNTSAVDRRGCVPQINELVLEYNIILEERIIELNTLFKDAEFIFCDVYSGLMEIIANPIHYGFEDAKSVCCGFGLHGLIIGCLSAEMACNQPSAHVWWDLYNPSQAVNSLLADAAWSGQTLSGICHPIMVEDMVYSVILHND